MIGIKQLLLVTAQRRGAQTWLPILLLLAATRVAAEDVGAWVNSLPADFHKAKVLRPIPRDQFFEVPVSMFELAEERLTKSAVIPQESYDIEAFGLRSFSCPTKTRPFLVRAIYENGRTGGYHLQQIDSALWVGHESLGAGTSKHRSALIVCLDFNPKEIYVTSGGGM